MTDQSFGRGKEIVETDAKTNLLDYFVGILGINVVFNSLSSIFAKVFWCNLDKIRNFGLLYNQIVNGFIEGDFIFDTHENEHGLTLQV